MTELKRTLDEKFIILETLGIGRYGKVKLSQDKDTNKKYAAKIVNDPNNRAELN